LSKREVVLMNKEFVKKMIKAEKYKYEAIKEILPQDLRKKVDEFEKDAFNLLKDVALEIMREDVEEETGTKVIKKVNVDFLE